MEEPNSDPPRVVFLWRNFGPMHADRVEAVARMYPGADCVGLELFTQDETYEWDSEARASFRKVTLFETEPCLFSRLKALFRRRKYLRRAAWFLCHYERWDICIFAFFLRATGARVFTMGCSKFDDRARRPFRDWLKSFFLLPYNGAIGSENRSVAYFHYLGFRRRPVVSPYNTLSLERMRAQADLFDMPKGSPEFDEGDWVIIARLVPKKNIAMALKAFQLYQQGNGHRRLQICGDGELRGELEKLCVELDISEAVIFHGFLQTKDISHHLARSFALILPSLEEQFGNVVIEAQALRLPVLLSQACGAADSLVRNWQNGFTFEPDNPEGLAGFMSLLDRDQTLWSRLSDAAGKSAEKGDVAAFAAAVKRLVEPGRAA